MTPEQIGRAVLCLASTVTPGEGGDPGTVNVTATFSPSSGTSAFDGDIVSNGAGAIPADWSSFTVTNQADSSAAITVGGISIPAGLSISHGTWDGYPGETIAVTAPAGATAVLTWVIPTTV